MKPSKPMSLTDPRVVKRIARWDLKPGTFAEVSGRGSFVMAVDYEANDYAHRSVLKAVTYERDEWSGKYHATHERLMLEAKAHQETAGEWMLLRRALNGCVEHMTWNSTQGRDAYQVAFHLLYGAAPPKGVP